MINKNLVVATALCGFLVLLPACWPFDKKDEIKAEQSLYVINVLDKDSYEDCRIAGSINVPFDQVENFAKNINKDAELVVYCSNYLCSSSAVAAQKLKELGFEHVYAYEGGTADWYQLGLKSEGKYPVEGTCQASYLLSANEKPAHTDSSSLAVISADELYEKMVAQGLLAAAQAPVQAAA
jgi:rhodanese-related sulfurtransferase